jgi:hypothetical protein
VSDRDGEEEEMWGGKIRQARVTACTQNTFHMTSLSQTYVSTGFEKNTKQANKMSCARSS